MKLYDTFSNSEEKYIAACNALVAKYTMEKLGAEQKRLVEDRILEMLLAYGIRPARARRYRSALRETQYYGMAAISLAFLGIRPALEGILFRERWVQVANPLIVLTRAEREIQKVSNEILRKHGLWITISDEDKNTLTFMRLIGESRTPRQIN